MSLDETFTIYPPKRLVWAKHYQQYVETFSPPPPKPVPAPALGRLDVRTIQALTCRHFGLQMADMTSGERSWKYARPRQIAIHLSRRYTNRSYPQLGRLFSKDHSTALNGDRRIAHFLAVGDPRITRAVRAIETEVIRFKATTEYAKAIEVMACET